jgi:cobalt-zinc-cadmium efflux system outer membrane protein
MSARFGVGAILFTLSCSPGAVDYSALRTAAEARQQAAGTSLVPRNATVRALLSRPLTAESAAHIAVLNNRTVRAATEELGITEARLVQARRLPNPALEGAVRFHGEGSPELELGALIDLTDLLLLGSRASAASAEVDAAKLAAVGAILDLSFDARRAFYTFQAAAELMELRRTVLQAFQAGADLAGRLREAGNITELDLANQQSSFEEARLQLQDAEIEHLSARERLNAVLGLWGGEAGWHAAARLPEPREPDVTVENLEGLAIKNSLDLAIAKHRYAAAAKRANLAQAEGLLPELKAGFSAERDEDWGVGPAVEIELPLFYQGQGEIALAKAQMRQQQSLYSGIAVELRAAARAAAARLTAKRQAALYYTKVVLPLKQRIVEQSQLEYNGMLIGLFQLLEAKRDQVEAAAAYVRQQREYWIARTDVEQLRAGRRPREASAASGASAPATAPAAADH